MRLASLDVDTVRYVAANMREWDRREIGATSWTDDPEELVGKCMACPGYAWVAGLDRPIVVIGGVPMWPGVWSMFMFATNEISNIGLGLTKFVARRMIPGLLDQGAHRLEARSMDGHVDAQSWLETFGAAREATLYGYGRGGEDFHVYVVRRHV